MNFKYKKFSNGAITGFSFYGFCIALNNLVNPVINIYLDYKRKSCLEEHKMLDSVGNKYDFFKRYFKGEECLLEGRFGQDIVEKLRDNRACYLPLISDLEDESLIESFSNSLDNNSILNGALSSSRLLAEIAENKLNCIIVYNNNWYNSSPDKKKRAQLRKEMNQSNSREDPYGLKKLLESTNYEKPLNLNTPKGVSDLYGYNFLLTFINFIYKNDYPRLLKRSKTVGNNILLTEGFEILAKPIEGEINDDTKIIVLEQTSHNTFHYSHTIAIKDLNKSKILPNLELIKADQINKIKDSLNKYGYNKYFSIRTHTSLISGGELSDEEIKLILSNEDIIFNKQNNIDFSH